jgi:hypothetical protein
MNWSRRKTELHKIDRYLAQNMNGQVAQVKQRVLDLISKYETRVIKQGQMK